MNSMNPFNYSPTELKKAIFGSLTAVVLGLGAVYSDNVLTTAEIWFVIGEGLASFGVIFGVSNE